MIKAMNIQVGEPQTEEQKKLLDMFGIQPLFDDEGRYWYDLIKKFQNNTYKFKISPIGEVLAASQDVSSINPIECSVVEMPNTPYYKKIAEGVYTDLDWYYEDGEFRRLVSANLIRLLKQRELTRVAKITQGLRAKRDLGLASDEELADLQVWLDYAAAVNAVEEVNDAQMPEPPDGQIAR